ncbi:MAG TPA: peptidase domain-containing ABC transporter [Blastocatellia bacterium]|nr:peptidase domain-containing ABC transporter [Blastocatellia bacterium]
MVESNFDYSPEPRRRRPKLVVRQRDCEDCGAAALATICAYFGGLPGLKYLRSLTKVSWSGTSLQAIAEAGAKIGLRCCGVETSYDELSHLRLPAIIAFKHHFVVLDHADEEQAVIGDPVAGWRTLSREEFCAQWNGTLLLFNVTPKFRALEFKRENALRQLWQLARSARTQLFSILWLTLGLNMIALCLPVLTQIIVDRHFTGGGQVSLRPMLALAGVALLVGGGVEAIRYLAINRVSWRLRLELGLKFIDHLLKLPLSYFFSRQTADSVSRAEDIQRLSEFLGSRGAEAVVDSLLAVLSMILIFYYSPELGMWLVVTGAALLLLSVRLGNVIYSRLLMAVQYQADAMTIIIEAVRKIALLKSCAAEPQWVARWHEKSMVAGKILRQASNLGGFLGVIAQLILRATPLIVVYVGTHDTDSLSPGAMVSIISFASISLSSVLNLSGHLIEAQKALLGVERIMDVLTEPHEHDSVHASRPEPARPTLARSAPPAPLIEVRGLAYRYGEGDESFVLQEVDLRIEPGSMVALIGRSGSGKTTLAYLLSRLLRPTAGEIRFDGRNIEDLSLTEMRRQVAIVPQESPLIRGSILENLALGESEPDRDRAISAARMVQAEEFILADPTGYDRMLNEDGAGLSAGQRQRIAIARALYRRPQILILDEPTSALDSESEASLMRSLRLLRGQQTIIIIAHRLQTVREVDQIFVIEESGVVEAGDPETLLAANGRYRALQQAGATAPS